MFDRSNSSDLTALKNEILNDPNSLGYNPSLGTQTVLDLINAKSASITAPIDSLTVSDISTAVDSGEFALTSEYDKEFVKMFINKPEDTTLEPYRDKLVSIFPNGSATFTAIQAKRSITGSRAEQLFGLGTVINRQDFLAARDS